MTNDIQILTIDGFDIKEIVHEKIMKNKEKYPVEKSKGRVKKYNEL